MRAAHKLISTMFAVVLLSAPAMAQKSGTYTGKLGVEGVGQTYDIEKGHVFFVGMFHGIFINDVAGGFIDRTEWTCPGVNDIVNGVSASAHGYCVVTDKDGDKAFLRWQEVKGTGPGTGMNTYDFAGGTGKFVGLQGHNSLHYTAIGNTTGFLGVVDSGEWRLP